VQCPVNVGGRSLVHTFYFLLKTTTVFLCGSTETCVHSCQTPSLMLALYLSLSVRWSLFNERGESSPHIYCSRWKKISSISPKMAADVGSMFQYWKKFDLRRLQVSAFRLFYAFFLQRCVSPVLPGARWGVWGSCTVQLAGFALIVIRNWSLFCLCSVQSLILR